ncbi:hypothetical protein ILP92_12740 [Maribius pontilimi]|uniref:Tetratricopeptide repeat-containing protein n=1 Tax=Palleronia pontilimi TaxID=1964209 RepID=A0A934IIN5_9RHOB|nr:hypothetical protein [Palleronia pontilimi]MBJ3763616.1 hypothetical protein [Palleronia pontilimi]
MTRTRLAPLIGLALAVTLGGPLAARDLSPAELRALTYYVEQGDAKAARAEMQRLRTLHPDWVPPEDLTRLNAATNSSGEGPGDDANRIWRLIEIGNLEAARGRLQHLQTVYPDWTPPAEMTRLLATAETQTQFDRAIGRGDANAAIAVARNNPGILRCDRVNNAWQLALMQTKVGDKAAALQTYRGVLGTCTDTGVLVATLQKSSAIATAAELRELASFAKARRPGALRSLTVAEQNLLAGKPAQDDTPAQDRATAQTSRRATEPQQTAEASQAPTPPRSGRLGKSGDTRLAAVRSAAKAGAWTQCLANSTDPRSVDVLYERAWCAYNQDRSLEALAAFRVASTAGLGATVDRDARFGMVLAMLANQMTEDAARLAATTSLTDEQRLDVETIILDQRGVRAFQRKEYRDAIAYLDALERLTGGIRRDLAIMRGYAYLNSGDRKTATMIFQELHDQLATPETRSGLRAALN